MWNLRNKTNEQRKKRETSKKNLFFLKIFYLFILTERETASERRNTSRGSRGSGRGRSRLIAKEPDVGLDPRTPGSRPEPKADT